MEKLFFLIVITIALGCSSVEETDSAKEQKNAEFITVLNKGNVNFDDYFLDKTMRLDYFHSGTDSEEHFAVDRILSDGAWGGSRNILIDKLELGPYFFEVVDKERGVLLYSRGFASIFGEWQWIPEAKEKWGTFHESIRFPWPKKEVAVIIKKRNENNDFQPIWQTFIDPESRKVNPANLEHDYKVDVILKNGPAQEKLDIVILGDGYAKDEMDKFKKDATRLSNFLFTKEPFLSRKSDFNVRAIETPASKSGVNKPHPGVFRRTPLSVTYSAFDSERYALAFDNQTVRDVASAVPYEFMVIILNEKTYGGGGIYKLYTTVAADNKFSEYIMIHEMGHHMAALADEYYTSSVSYEMQPIEKEPWETNITALLDRNNLKWAHLVAEDTPIPTPWNKEEFDEHGYLIQEERDSLRAAKVPESVVEDLFVRQLKQENKLFSKEKYKDKVGAFEGAGYMQYGLYRSQLDCIMFTRHTTFCKVCQNSISDVIDQYVN